MGWWTPNGALGTLHDTQGGKGETPLSLVFGIEAVIPAEVGLLSYRVENYAEQVSNVALLDNLDFLEEKRDQAAIRLATQSI